MKKTDDVVKAYAIFSQGIVTILCLTGLGFYIGWKIDKHSALCGILAVVGSILGIVTFIITIYKAHYFDDKNQKKKKGEDDDEK